MILQTLNYALTQGIATITFDEQGSPVNTMCQQWQQDLATVTAQLLQDKAQVRGVILASAKSTFFAGADLKSVMRTGPDDGPRFFKEIEAIKRCFRHIETLGVPVVTCINGAALGGGLEVALVGHHRIAVNNDKLLLGFPEVNLGLIPGGGGITKLTRLLGLLAAQPYLMECKLFNPQEALKLGVVHALVDTDAQLREHALAYIEAAQGKPEAAQHVWDRKDYKMPGGSPNTPQLAGLLSVAPAMLKQKTRGLYPAPEAALAAMVEGALVDFDTAMRIESRYLAALMRSQVTRNMINTFFFNMNSYRLARKTASTTAPTQPDATQEALRLLLAEKRPARPGEPAWPTGTAFIGRLLRVYVAEGQALAAEGVPTPAIENLALHTGMAWGPLALVEAMAPAEALAPQAKTPELEGQDIKDRLLYRQAIEAAHCLSQGVTTVADANLESIFGLGFPAWTGGALQFVYGQGVGAFQRRCEELAERYGAGFVVTPEVINALEQHQPVY